MSSHSTTTEFVYEYEDYNYTYDDAELGLACPIYEDADRTVIKNCAFWVREAEYFPRHSLR